MYTLNSKNLKDHLLNSVTHGITNAKQNLHLHTGEKEEENENPK
jgi:hypothetical protein